MGRLVENAAHPLGARHASSPGRVADSLIEFARQAYPQQRRFAGRRKGWTTSTAGLLRACSRASSTSRVDVSFVDHASLAVAQFFVIGHIRPETVGPTLLDGPSVEILGYPIATVLAEELSTAVQLGEANTRIRDYVDLYNLTGTHPLDFRRTRLALLATAAYRRIKPRPLSTAVGQLATIRAGAYRTYRTYRTGLGADGTDLPDSFTEVITAVTAFADPLCARRAAPHWEPTSRRWN